MKWKPWPHEADEALLDLYTCSMHGGPKASGAACRLGLVRSSMPAVQALCLGDAGYGRDTPRLRFWSGVGRVELASFVVAYTVSCSSESEKSIRR